MLVTKFNNGACNRINEAQSASPNLQAKTNANKGWGITKHSKEKTNKDIGVLKYFNTENPHFSVNFLDEQRRFPHEKHEVD